MGETGKGGQKVLIQISKYKKISPGHITYGIVTIVNSVGISERS